MTQYERMINGLIYDPKDRKFFYKNERIDLENL